MSRTRRTTAAKAEAGPVPKARTVEDRALEAWYANFSHPPDDLTCCKRFDRADGVPVTEIIKSIVDYETSRSGGVNGELSISSRKVCAFLDAKAESEKHRVRRIGEKGDKNSRPAFMVTTAKSELPPPTGGKHQVKVDGRKMKKLAAEVAAAQALKDENEQLKVDIMAAASPLSAEPAEEQPPPPTEVKANSGHRYSAWFVLAMAELFSVAKGLTAATASHLIAFITYFMLLELWRIRAPWLSAEPCLADIINITPSASTLGSMRRFAGDVRDCSVAEAIFVGLALGFLVFDDGNKKGIKRKAILLVGYDFINNCIMEYLLDATVVYSGTGLATAATLAQVVRRYGVTQLGGQAGDNASDVASAGTAMAESYTDYVFIGCVLHIMQLIIVNACVVAYGDDCGMGVNTALRMVFIVNYLQTEFRTEWNHFRRTTPGADVCGVIPLGSKGRWWSLTAAFNLIIAHRLILIGFTTYLLQGKGAGSATYVTIVNEVDSWLRNDKVFSDMIFMMCFCNAWWNVHMKWFHGHDPWQENLPAFQQKGGYRCPSMPYYLYFMMRELRELSLNGEWLRDWREFNDKNLNPAQKAEAMRQGQKMLDTALNMAEKHMYSWWTKLLPCALFRHDEDPELTLLVARTMIACIDGSDQPPIPEGMAKVTIKFGLNCVHEADTADLLNHIFQFVDVDPNVLLKEGAVFTANPSNVALLRTVLEFDMDLSQMNKSDDRHEIAWIEFQRITKIEKGRPFHSQVAERAVNKMNPNAKKGNTNQKEDLMGITVAANDQFAAERAEAAYNVSEERDLAKLLKEYDIEISADEIKEEYVKLGRKSSSWLNPGQPVKVRAYRVKSRKIFAEQIRLAKARFESQTTVEALRKLDAYRERVQREGLTRMDVDAAGQQPKFDQMEASSRSSTNHTTAIPTSYIPSDDDPTVPQSARGTWDLSGKNNKAVGGDTVLQWSKAVAIVEIEMRCPQLETKLGLTRFTRGKHEKELNMKLGAMEKKLIEYCGGPIIERLCDSEGGLKMSVWLGERSRVEMPPLATPTTPAVAGTLPTITPSPALTAAALTTNTPHTAAEATPASAAEVGEANGAMDVEGEGEVASTMRKHQRGADGGVVVVASVQLGGMSPTRVGTSGVRVQHSSPDRN